MANYLLLNAGDSVNIGIRNTNSAPITITVNGTTKIAIGNSNIDSYYFIYACAKENGTIVTTNPNWSGNTETQVCNTVITLNGDTGYRIIDHAGEQFGFVNTDLKKTGVAYDLTVFTTALSAFTAMLDGNWTAPETDIPITYYLTNCSAPSAPTSVQPGGTVSFPVTVSPGYNIFNPVQGGSISVYQGNDYIPFTFENGQLTFTAPGGG